MLLPIRKIRIICILFIRICSILINVLFSYLLSQSTCLVLCKQADIDVFFFSIIVHYAPNIYVPAPLSFRPYCRPKDTETEKVKERQRGQEAAHGLHGRAAAETEDGVPGEPLHHGAAAPGSGPGAQPQRVPDQNLVPEQEGQDQKGQRLQERSGAAVDGAGTVQPLHHHHPGGQGGGQRLRTLLTPCTV